MKLHCFLLSMLVAFGQTPKPKTTETPEHKIIAERLATAQRSYDTLSAKAKEITSKDPFQVSQEELEASAALLKKIMPTIKEADSLIAISKTQLEHVDNCTKLYRATIDKKTSDLTVRETSDVKTCQDLKLYPFEMPTQTQKQP